MFKSSSPFLYETNDDQCGFVTESVCDLNVSQQVKSAQLISMCECMIAEITLKNIKGEEEQVFH